MALPMWNQPVLWGPEQHLAVLDPKLRKLLVFRREFRVLQLQAFIGLLITGVDSPIHNPKPVFFHLETEAIKQVFEL